jgi:hypothetical protein
MLWSQFSAIFANFWQKIGVFLKNECYDANFLNISCVLNLQGRIFRHFFGENIWKIITSVSEPSPWDVECHLLVSMEEQFIYFDHSRVLGTGLNIAVHWKAGLDFRKSFEVCWSM